METGYRYTASELTASTRTELNEGLKRLSIRFDGYDATSGDTIIYNSGASVPGEVVTGTDFELPNNGTGGIVHTMCTDDKGTITCDSGATHTRNTFGCDTGLTLPYIDKLSSWRIENVVGAVINLSVEIYPNIITKFRHPVDPIWRW